ncbi:MAG: hypothetical protein Fur0043_03640 [Anaerolineales bacterium]
MGFLLIADSFNTKEHEGVWICFNTKGTKFCVVSLRGGATAEAIPSWRQEIASPATRNDMHL